MNSCNRSPKCGYNILKGVLPVVLLCPAFVSSATEFDRQAYVGAGFGLTNFSLVGTDGVELELTENYSSTGKLVLGRDFSPRLTGELHYHDLGKASLDVQSGVSYTDIGVSGLIYLYGASSYRNGLSLYTRLGVGHIETEGSIAVERDHPIHLIAGAGVEFATSSGVAFRADYIHHDEDAMSGSLSLLYRFGADRQDNSMAEAPLTLETATTSAEPPTPTEPLPELPQAPDPAPETLPELASSPELPSLPELQPLPPQQPFIADPVYPELADNNTAEPIDTQPAPAPQINSNTSVFWSELSDPEGQARPALDFPIERLNFLIGSTELTGRSIQILERVANLMQQNSNLILEIGSHTDNRGDPAENLQLSKKRAVSVAKYLNTWGIAVRRIEAIAYGGKRPIASNDTAAGRQANRRVELNLKDE